MRNVNRLLRLGLVLIVTLLLGQTPPAQPAQSSRDQTPQSLGEIARKLREEKASQAKAAATRVYDNDSMKPAPSSEVNKPEASGPKGATIKTISAELEKKYRTQFAKQRAALKQAETESKSLNDDLARNSPGSPFYDVRWQARSTWRACRRGLPSISQRSPA